MNIMYYDVQGEVKNSPNGIEIGPIKITPEQLSIGVITNLVVVPPSMLLVNLFRRSRRRVTRSTKLKLAIKKVKAKYSSRRVE